MHRIVARAAQRHEVVPAVHDALVGDRLRHDVVRLLRVGAAYAAAVDHDARVVSRASVAHELLGHAEHVAPDRVGGPQERGVHVERAAHLEAVRRRPGARRERAVEHEAVVGVASRGQVHRDDARAQRRDLRQRDQFVQVRGEDEGRAALGERRHARADDR